MPYKRILLIDDDEDDREIFMAAVAKISATVACQGIDNAAIALDKLKAGAIVPDLILLDLNMPAMDGPTFLASIKNEPLLAHIPVIIFTTASDLNSMQQTVALGAEDFISKPASFTDWINLLRPYLAQPK